MVHGYPSMSKMRSYFIKLFMMNKTMFHIGTKGAAVYIEYTAVHWGYLIAPCGCFNLKNYIVVPLVPIFLHALPLANNCSPFETNLG